MSKKRHPRTKEMRLTDILGTRYEELSHVADSFIDDAFFAEREILQDRTEKIDKLWPCKINENLTFAQLGEAQRAAKKLYPSLFALTAKQDNQDILALVTSMLELGSFPLDLYNTPEEKERQEKATARYLINHFSEAKDDRFFASLHDFPLQGGEDGHPGFSYSGEELGKLEAIIRLRKKEKNCRRFFIQTLALLGDDTIVKVLRSSITLFNAFVIAFQEVSRAADDIHFANCRARIGDDPFTVVDRLLKERDKKPPKGFAIPAEISRFQQDHDELAMSMIGKVNFNIPLAITSMANAFYAFPSHMTKEDCPPLLKRAIRKRWKETESNELFFSLLLLEHYDLPYNKYPLILSFLSVYAMGRSEHLIKQDHTLQKGERKTNPRFSIDKPAYKADSRYLDWLIRYQDYMPFKEYCTQHEKRKPTTLTIRQVLTFALGGVSLPSRIEVDKALCKELETIGCDEKEATLYALIAEISRATVGRRYVTKAEQEEIDRKQETKEEPIEKPKQTDEELEKRMENALEAQKGLEKRLSRLRHEHLMLEREKSSLEQTSGAIRKENARLKEALFSLESEDEEKLEERDNIITFPFRTKKNIIVFGGHENFRANLLSLIPSLRCITTGKADFPSLIRNASAIYLQTNKMGHPMYDAITDVARKEGQEIHYLKSSSSHRCALQIAKDVMAHPV